MPERVNPYIREVERQIFKFSATAEINRLTEVQKVNQRVTLSFYGKKIDMPFKLLSSTDDIEIVRDVAVIKEEKFSATDAYRLEITHPLGKIYCRFEVPRTITTSSIGGDAITISELNMKAKQDFEDYLVNRRQYDLEFASMDVTHRQARLARKYEFITKGIGLAMSTASLAYAGIKGGINLASVIKSSMASADKINRARLKKRASQINLGVRGFRSGLDYFDVLEPDYESVGKLKKKRFGPLSYKMQDMGMSTALATYSGLSGVASGIAGLVSASERASLQDEAFAIEIEQKALRSYQIDLGFEREKDEQLFTMRRIFANETYNQVSDRQKQKVLDELESPAITDEIYLEVWTTSGEQEDYVKVYHEKYGVDCRVVKKEIAIRDDMRKGIYCIEDVIIENLTDRVDFEYLKARLTAGIKFIEWQEFKGEKEFHPVDERVKELQGQIVVLKRQHQEDQALIKENLQEIRDANIKLQTQAGVDADKYHELSESYKKKEAELSTQTNLAVLYKNEADHLRKDLLAESSKHAQEKEEHSSTKEQLTSLNQKYEEKEQELNQQKKLLSDCSQEKKNLEQEKSVLTEQVKQQQEELKDLKQKKQLTEEEYRQLKGTVDGYERRIHSLTEDNNNLTLQGDKRIKELEELKQQLEEASKKGLDSHTYEAQNKQLLDEVASLKKEALELQYTLGAVREINQNLEQQLSSKQIKKVNDVSNVMKFFSVLWGNDLYNTEDTRIIIQMTGTSNFFEELIFHWGFKCLVRNVNWNRSSFKGYPSYRVWKLDGPKIVGGNLQTGRQEIRNYYKDYSSYFDEPYTTWEQIMVGRGGKLIAPMKNSNVNVFNIKVFGSDTCIPFFYIGYGGEAGTPEWQIGNTRSVYWLHTKKQFSYIAEGTKGKDWMLIKNYGDYNKALKM